MFNLFSITGTILLRIPFLIKDSSAVSCFKIIHLWYKIMAPPPPWFYYSVRLRSVAYFFCNHLCALLPRVSATPWHLQLRCDSFFSFRLFYGQQKQIKDVSRAERDDNEGEAKAFHTIHNLKMKHHIWIRELSHIHVVAWGDSCCALSGATWVAFHSSTTMTEETGKQKSE